MEKLAKNPAEAPRFVAVAGNFQRKVTHATDRDDRDYVISIGKNSEPGERGGRPAALYRAGPADKIEPPIIRP